VERSFADGRQTVARAPLCPIQGFVESQSPVPIVNCLPEYEENRLESPPPWTIAVFGLYRCFHKAEKAFAESDHHYRYASTYFLSIINFSNLK